MLLVLGVLPASFIIWLCILIIFLSCLRVRVHRHLEEAEAEAVDPANSRARLAAFLSRNGGAAPVVQMLPGGGVVVLHSDAASALARINMDLRSLEDAEMGASGELAAWTPLERAACGWAACSWANLPDADAPYLANSAELCDQGPITPYSYCCSCVRVPQSSTRSYGAPSPREPWARRP